jgi:carbohydrate kinase (thermoresistant glucokinase family)
MITSVPRLLVVMGVSGSGKSTVGADLAGALGRPFVDADSLHPAVNVAKMAQGTPLTDADRWPWLAAVGRVLAEAGPAGVVVACSALRRSYRDAIRNEAPEAVFVELDGEPALLADRIGHREGHFMPATLLDSQLATLEPLSGDEAGVRISIAGTPDQIVAAAMSSLAGERSPANRSGTRN